MKNYIKLNGTKIELTQEQVEEMQKSFGITQLQLKDIPVGEPFKIGKYEFVVLEHAGNTSAVIFKGLLHTEKEFGKNNNYDGSYVDELCNDFASDIEAIIGEENLVEHTVDLTSDDGLKDYGRIRCKISLITTEQYRRYVDILDKHKPDTWWWLATADSTPKHTNSNWIKCVSPHGGISYGGSYRCNGGVRPFCILKSNIFVSK